MTEHSNERNGTETALLRHCSLENCCITEAQSTLQHRKRSHSKTLSRVERFENDAFWKRFLVWTEKTMLSENGDVIKIDTTGRQTTRPWVSKMVDRCYHVASISRQFRRPINWNAHASSSFAHVHWGFSKRIRRCSVDGRKRYENDKCGRKSFLKQSKTAPFLFENGLVWTGPEILGNVLDQNRNLVLLGNGWIVCPLFGGHYSRVFRCSLPHGRLATIYRDIKNRRYRSFFLQSLKEGPNKLLTASARLCSKLYSVKCSAKTRVRMLWGRKVFSVLFL